MIKATNRPVGDTLREWRQRRRLSQLALAMDAEVSTRHLSFLETGRAAPSRDMVLRLAEQLEIPLRERNALLLAAGFAPTFPERPLDDPALQSARRTIDRVLAAHAPYPALAIDRHWNLIAANQTVPLLLAGAAEWLLRPPVNVLRLSLHPQGLAPRIANLPQWRAHLLERLRRQATATADPFLAELGRELRAYSVPDGNRGVARVAQREAEDEYAGMAVPLRLTSEAGILSFLSTTTVFGTPLDITLSEIALESFFPADTETTERLRGLV